MEAKASQLQQQQQSAFAPLLSIVTGGSGGQSQASSLGIGSQETSRIGKALAFGQVQANIVGGQLASNGFVYIIDGVLIAPDDAEHLQLTGSSPSVSSSILGAHSNLLGDFIQALVAPSQFSVSARSAIILISILVASIVGLLLLLTVVLVVRRRKQNKLNRHRQLDGLNSCSSASQAGSTSSTNCDT